MGLKKRLTFHEDLYSSTGTSQSAPAPAPIYSCPIFPQKTEKPSYSLIVQDFECQIKEYGLL